LTYGLLGFRCMGGGGGDLEIRRNLKEQNRVTTSGSPGWVKREQCDSGRIQARGVGKIEIYSLGRGTKGKGGR